MGILFYIINFDKSNMLYLKKHIIFVMKIEFIHCSNIKIFAKLIYLNDNEINMSCNAIEYID